MRMTSRIAEIVDLDSEGGHMTLLVDKPSASAYPVYRARPMGEQSVAIPVTNSGGIGEALSEPGPAHLLVVDRAAGYEAYLLDGRARYVSEDEDFDLAAEMRNTAPGLPVHGAVILEVQSARLVPPP